MRQGSRCVRIGLLGIVVLSLSGCGDELASTVNGRFLGLGGVFWPASTPAYATATSRNPVLFVPRGAICDVRFHPGATTGRYRVKVLVDDRWHDVWVDKVQDPTTPGYDEDSILLGAPFESVSFMTNGTEEDPDFQWALSEKRLRKAAAPEIQKVAAGGYPYANPDWWQPYRPWLKPVPLPTYPISSPPPQQLRMSEDPPIRLERGPVGALPDDPVEYFSYDLNGDGRPEYFVQAGAGVNKVSFLLVDAQGKSLLVDSEEDSMHGGWIFGDWLLILEETHEGYHDLLMAATNYGGGGQHWVRWEFRDGKYVPREVDHGFIGTLGWEEDRRFPDPCVLAEWRM